mmetsp:Transcript_6322/g.16268  ORF Transcript_6322/g.16268 Transcript_6322/m.16268 type:complete len:274 (+) Transcript_6322:415-1236(+)
MLLGALLGEAANVERHVLLSLIGGPRATCLVTVGSGGTLNAGSGARRAHRLGRPGSLRPSADRFGRDRSWPRRRRLRNGRGVRDRSFWFDLVHGSHLDRGRIGDLWGGCRSSHLGVDTGSWGLFGNLSHGWCSRGVLQIVHHARKEHRRSFDLLEKFGTLLHLSRSLGWRCVVLGNCTVWRGLGVVTSGCSTLGVNVQGHALFIQPSEDVVVDRVANLGALATFLLQAERLAEFANRCVVGNEVPNDLDEDRLAVWSVLTVGLGDLRGHSPRQ